MIHVFIKKPHQHSFIFKGNVDTALKCPTEINQMNQMNQTRFAFIL